MFPSSLIDGFIKSVCYRFVHYSIIVTILFLNIRISLSVSKFFTVVETDYKALFSMKCKTFRTWTTFPSPTPSTSSEAPGVPDFSRTRDSEDLRSPMSLID